MKKNFDLKILTEEKRNGKGEKKKVKISTPHATHNHP